MAPVPREHLESFCRMLGIRGEKTLPTCVDVLQEAIEKGYVLIRWEEATKYHVAKLLRDKGVLMRYRLPDCRKDTYHHFFAPDRKRLAHIRMVLEYLDRPPSDPCL